MAAMGRPHIRHPFGCNFVALHADMMALFVFLFFWVQNNTGNLGAILPVPLLEGLSNPVHGETLTDMLARHVRIGNVFGDRLPEALRLGHRQRRRKNETHEICRHHVPVAP